MLNINRKMSFLFAFYTVGIGCLLTGECALVDINGNAVTNETALGDIDMAKGTMGDMKEAIAPSYSNLTFEVDNLTNIVKRSNKTFNLGSANIIGLFSTAVGNNNTLGNRSTVFGFNNTLLPPSSGNAQQYAFGLGNRSTAPNNFIVGVGSGAMNEEASYSISLGTMSVSTNLGSFVWNWYPTDYSSVQADEIFDLFPKYYSHGNGTFNVNPIGGLRGFWIGETNLEDHIIATAMEPIATAANIVTDNLKDFVTNSLVVGYTDWKYTGNVSPTAVYTITMTDAGGGNYNFSLNETVSVTTLGTVTTNTLNPTVLIYDVPGITASRDEIRRNQNGFAYYSDVKTLRDDVENMDTSYFHYSLQNTVTNVNQSVQYVNTDANTTQLEIKIPTSGMTKDWVIYVNPIADVNLILPPANYWVSDEATTNAIPAYTPTALYFSQINEDTFSLGRKEFVPVTVPSPTMLSMQRARSKAKTKGKVGVRSVTAQPVIKK